MAIANDGAGNGLATDAELNSTDQRRAESLKVYLTKYAKGELNAVPVTELATALEVSARKVRTLVTYLRRTGQPVLATPDSGYFWPRSREEAEHTIAFLTARLASTQTVRSGILRGLDSEFGQAEQLELVA